MILLIDNYDSFTYNLWHYLGEVGASVEVRRNDALNADEAIALNPQGIVISPGPCDPDQAGICLELVEKAAGKIPLFGVCLGHQAIGQAFGGKIVRAPACMHGKTSTISHTGTGVFAGIPDDFTATRYHSLTIEPDSMPDCLDVTARSEDGVIQGIAHKELPIYGVQFHPESIVSEHGHAILRNFINMTSERAAA
ncbi:MAG: aminodeoxychorismate/anthranilate synthase component II [Rhodospirillales bacterium]|jgi:anthranilate synthase component II|nr:aminodeoxychorismate/anthranilate synthase component II [Rhodospirillales bacterium]MBT4038805.1 aminodeoxychorismate/anthranilate synthase component II [Rhodospirillales bacterium]MBT4625096.1 aminodeoxychorismate/anthranilate synthase component II [Rhodospirillales bacterium]MBT5352969.1 aminodeoxychorismate/anthranilate synthase component II [Rhodospirillales bacterium]MBT5519724.1 aminodeoxychorismate/anthranilate synthase component II [Rhodospirillales bacterium]